MGQVRHGSATTTHAVRAAIQRSQASLSVLSDEFEPVSVFRQIRELIRNKVDATRRERRFGSV